MGHLECPAENRAASCHWDAVPGQGKCFLIDKKAWDSCWPIINLSGWKGDFSQKFIFLTMDTDYDNAGLPGGESCHRVKGSVEDIVLVTILLAAALFPAIPSHDGWCRKPSGGVVPKLCLSRATLSCIFSLGKCRLALARGLKCTSATSSHTPPSLLVLALLYADLCAAIHIFVRYLPWSLITPSVYLVYFLLLGLQFASDWL